MLTGFFVADTELLPDDEFWVGFFVAAEDELFFVELLDCPDADEGFAVEELLEGFTVDDGALVCVLEGFLVGDGVTFGVSSSL